MFRRDGDAVHRHGKVHVGDHRRIGPERDRIANVQAIDLRHRDDVARYRFVNRHVRFAVHLEQLTDANRLAVVQIDDRVVRRQHPGEDANKTQVPDVAIVDDFEDVPEKFGCLRRLGEFRRSVRAER